jgi:hypothetical protein
MANNDGHIPTLEVKRKLSDWAGFRWDTATGNCIYPNGDTHAYPDFMENLESCFLWLLPRLKLIKVEFVGSGISPNGDITEWQVGIVSWAKPTLNPVWGFAKSPSEALCRAIYNLISGRDGTKDIRIATDQ